jgi:hypothetical protein
MSRENVELIRRVVALLNEGADLEATASQYLHPEIEVRDLQHPPGPAALEAVRAEGADMGATLKGVKASRN